MRSILFYVAIALAVIAVAAAIYFYIPGIYHPYLSIENGHLVLIGPDRHLRVSTSRHRFYTGACVLFAAVLAVIGFLLRPRKVAVA